MPKTRAALRPNYSTPWPPNPHPDRAYSLFMTSRTNFATKPELVQLKVDVIVAPGAAASRAAQHATRTIPIVMAGTFDPVEAGFVASLAQPGGNITGLSYLGDELRGKRLELLKETVPQSTRIAVLGYPEWPGYASVLSHLTVAARALGLLLHVVEVHSVDELDHAFMVMTGAGAEAVL